MRGPAGRLPARTGVVAALSAVLLGLVALNLGMGAVTIAPSQVVGVLSDRVGLGIGSEPAPGVDAVVWTIRMPRIMLGVVVGGGLAAAGVALQGLFRNPLADPHLLGIGPGAAIGAVIGAAIWGPQAAILAGAAVGVVVALFVRQLARRVSGEAARFILVGVALGAALTAWVGFIVFASDRSTVPPMEFWLLGSLSAATWRVLATTAVVVVGAVAGLFIVARPLDVLSLGGPEARHLGVNVSLVTSVVLVAVGIVAGASVGAAGVIGFVGLVIPNVLRRPLGPAHRMMLVASIIGGAAFVLAADLVARTAIAPAEIAVGLLTAVVGGPVLLGLLARRRVA